MITKKREDIYRIENKGAAREVYTSQAQPGTEVTVRAQDQEWSIEETNDGTAV